MATTRIIVDRLQRQRGNNNELRSPLSSPSRLHLRNPNDVGLGNRLQTAVMQMRESSKPTNTQKAMQPKIDEFFQYCDLVYGHDRQYKYTLDFEKVYKFMWYQVFREQKKRGGDKLAKAKGECFDLEAYRSLMESFRTEEDSIIPVFPTPVKPIGKPMFDSYRAAIRQIYRVQVARGALNVPWEHIWQMGFDELFKHVKERAPQIKRLTYQEKVTGEFAPFHVVEKYPDIEKSLWEDSERSVGCRSVATNLRHRYCLLHLTSGILRCESLHRAELSDFICLLPPRREHDVHQVFLMVNQIAIGKTNHGRVLYGRATRHRDVNLCCIGAISFYLMYRFYVTKEFQDFTLEDWFDNEKWFDVKLLVDVNSSDKTKEISNDGYSKHIKRTLGKHRIVQEKLCHLGRKLGVKILDLLEEESPEIQRMGNWNPSMMDKSYSSKLPMGPIRKLAGYSGNSKMYFNTRTTVEPCDDLLALTPIGGQRSCMKKQWNTLLRRRNQQQFVYCDFSTSLTKFSYKMLQRCCC
jgi:Centromere DNA-binding protein complex CBF3 subunit, domain 2